MGRPRRWLGYLGVPVFIVLSGYLLMLPFLKDDGCSVLGSVCCYDDGVAAK